MGVALFVGDDVIVAVWDGLGVLLGCSIGRVGCASPSVGEVLAAETEGCSDWHPGIEIKTRMANKTKQDCLRFIMDKFYPKTIWAEF